jgi:GMP synthase-like glutamine amidotransferase
MTKPVLIVRHASHEGPGYCAQFLDAHQIPWVLLKVDESKSMPSDVTQYSGIVLMGGPMSVNDDLAWIQAEINLIQKAYAMDIPVIGHCLGGQLMSKAFGAKVERNLVKEIGWGGIEVINSELAQDWIGNMSSFEAFHWHGETFSIPEGATHLFASEYCSHQAWVKGKHLAMQCHVEMTEEMIKTWCEVGRDEILSAHESPGVQSELDMQKNLSARVSSLNNIADILYRRWILGLKQ